ncbi:ABC transporter substrate-binding protein [Paenibacillus nanensis]|uniref:ABC transporter substrate-binding protein n=1 Tax=Paenibacillus nanensis TaxID=393251 RepID=A0A3A1UQC0_9BACL|nr:ABC transporter substrate-binding protein [Paenibacillus nanensis]RIX50747.1 ABC transporter substrate-binding protein [Paenibacillus nanensis]
MGKKKLVTIAMSLFIAASALAGCSGGNSNKNNETSASQAPASSDQPASVEPVTFTYFNFQSRGKDVMASETTIGKILQEQTGVDWKMEYLVGEEDTKAGVMIASGDYPDVIAPEGQIDKLLDAGAFMPLDDLIEQYGPNIKRVYGPYFDKFRQADGKIYFLPYSADQGYIGDPNISQGAFWMQRSVLKEFGYPKVKTLDQYFDLIRQYKEKHPQVEGKDTIGFAVFAPSDTFYNIQNAAVHLAGYPNDGGVYVNMDTHEAKVVAGTDDIQKPWMKALNEIYAEGLFDAESFTMNKDQFMAKVTSGRLLGYFAYNWQIGEATNNLKTAGIDEKRYAPLPVVFNENIKDQYVDPPSFVNNRGVGISVDAKDPVRIIQYFDNLLKEENQILVQWGEKDVTYSVDEKGRYFMTEEQQKNRDDTNFKLSYGFQYFEYGWPRYGSNSLLADGNSYGVGNQPEVAASGFTDGDKELLAAYDAATFSDYFSDPDDRPWYPAWSINLGQGTPEQIFTTKSDDLQKKYLPKMIMEAPDKFEATWAEYMKEFNKLDKATYEKTMNEMIQNRIAGKW